MTDDAAHGIRSCLRRVPVAAVESSGTCTDGVAIPLAAEYSGSTAGHTAELPEDPWFRQRVYRLLLTLQIADA